MPGTSVSTMKLCRGSPPNASGMRPTPTLRNIRGMGSPNRLPDLFALAAASCPAIVAAGSSSSETSTGPAPSSRAESTSLKNSWLSVITFGPVGRSTVSVRVRPSELSE